MHKSNKIRCKTQKYTKRTVQRKPDWLAPYGNQLEELGALIFVSNLSQTCLSNKLNPNIGDERTKFGEIWLTNWLGPLLALPIWNDLALIFDQHNLHWLVAWNTRSNYHMAGYKYVCSFYYFLYLKIISFSIFLMKYLSVSIIMVSSSQKPREIPRRDVFTIGLIVLGKKVIQPWYMEPSLLKIFKPYHKIWKASEKYLFT